MRTITIMAGLLAAIVSACATAADEPASGPAGPAATIADALVLGARAEAANDAAALVIAAETLRFNGALPADGTPNLADRWADLARAQGETASVPRGRVAGPAYRQGELAAEANLKLREVFAAGRSAVILLRAQDGTALRLTATRDGENLCTLETTGAPAECRWTPVFTEPVDIEVENLSARPARYYLVTN